MGEKQGWGNRMEAGVGCSSKFVILVQGLEVKFNLFIICPPQNLGEATPHSVCF